MKYFNFHRLRGACLVNVSSTYEIRKFFNVVPYLVISFLFLFQFNFPSGFIFAISVPKVPNETENSSVFYFEISGFCNVRPEKAEEDNFVSEIFSGIGAT